MYAIEHVTTLRDHWWWRPGWRTGRHFYACHLTMGDQADLWPLVAAYQDALARVDGLDIVPRRWLHLTMQGIGFADQITHDELDSIAESVGAALRSLTAPTVTFYRAVVRPEAVYLPAEPPDPLRKLRATVRDGIANALGPDRTPNVADKLNSYRPHVSVAYANRDQAAEPIVSALRSVDLGPVRVAIDRVSLLEFHRDHRMYEWTSSTPLPLGQTTG
jgi:2'-5' RNA ligase